MLNHPNSSILIPKYQDIDTSWKYSWKYYKWPFKYFYQHKLNMMTDLMRQRYDSILDYGTGSGILVPELKRRSKHVVAIQRMEDLRTFEKFECIVCGSVLEFGNIEESVKFLDIYLEKFGDIIVGSPMQTWKTKLYYKLIGNKQKRNSHIVIYNELAKRFLITDYITWGGMYFAMKARKV